VWKCALAAIAAFVALMTWPLMASATTSNDSAFGTGSTTAFPYGGDPAGPAPAHVSFNASSNFNGTEPFGSVSVTIGANRWDGDVTCLQVSGNFAQISGYIERAQGSENFMGAPPVTWYIETTDNGSSGDQMLFSMGPQQLNFNTCAPVAFSGTMDQAAVTVHDG
jgi:hypothetical protein